MESDANASPEDVEKQVKLFKELVVSGAERAVVSRWETAMLANPNSPLLASEEAFNLYLLSLSRTGQARNIVEAVRQRDALIGNSVKSSSGVLLPSGSTPADASVLGSTATASVVDSTTTGIWNTLVSRIRGRVDTPQPQKQPASAGANADTITISALDEIGARARPVHVVVEESRQLSGGRVVRSLLTTAFYAFCFLTIASLVLENSGLMKVGQQPTEFEPEDGKIVKFSDVHGVDEAKSELEEVVEFLRNPEKFSNLGGKLPKGVLLTGPPGTGKTMLARAVAGEAGVPFFFASGSSFDEVYVGVGQRRIRELFALARKRSPAIIFIDELDAVGSKRAGREAQHMRQTLNQLLVELDGFEESEGIVVIAATNFPDSLDPALVRPGRFDRNVVVPLPDVRGRVAILKHHMADVQFDVDVDPSIIARGTPGMSGADLRNLVNTAAIKASKEGSKHVTLRDFEWAKDRILMGAERKSHFVTPEGKKMTAYHEAGHALMALRTKGAHPLHKVTIMPRGRALGITFQLPEADKDSYTRKEMTASIDVALGGRAAEELIYGKDDTTTGCSSDLERATQVAGAMVKHYGFSEKIGLVAHSNEDFQYLSGARKDEIESETRRFIDDGWKRTVTTLQNNMDDLHTLANALVEYETLNLDEVKAVLRGEKLDRGEALASAGARQKAARDGKKEKQGKKTTDLAGAPIYGDLDLAKSRQESHEQRTEQR
ncbi:i-AAA protease yme1 [Naganishia albida]|nr:i-AAA protease yme1 [Naganishia albida]